MQKNTAGKWIVFAFEDEGGTNPGEPVTGDAANITADVHIDGAAANAVDDTNPAELAGGYYIFDITAAEANGDNIVLVPTSATANVNVIGVPGALYTTPANFPDMDILATGEVGLDFDNVAGTLTNANLAFIDVNDRIDANVELWLGSAPAALADTDKVQTSIQHDGIGVALAANLTTVLNRIGSFTGSGVNTILGFLQALMRKDVATPSDVGGTYDDATDSLEALRDQGDSAWITATGFSTHTAAGVRTEMDANSTQLAAIVADTGELQGDWVDGGRLDLILDARASQASVDALNDLSTADVKGQADQALVDIHLDHLFAADYDPATPPGVATAWANELVESDAGVTRFTANALESYFLTALPGGSTAGSPADVLETLDAKFPTGNIGDQSTLDQIAADLPNIFTKNTAFSNFAFLMIDSADDISPKTGLTVSGEVSIDGAAFSGLSNAITEIGNGWYKVDITAAELNGDSIVLRFTSAGANDRGFAIYPQPS